MFRRTRRPRTQLGGSAWAGLGSMGAPSRYTDSRGRVKDLDEFTDWRSVRLPPQRKSRTAILGELNCGPAGRPIPDKGGAMGLRKLSQKSRPDRLAQQLGGIDVVPDAISAEQFVGHRTEILVHQAPDLREGGFVTVTRPVEEHGHGSRGPFVVVGSLLGHPVTSSCSSSLTVSRSCLRRVASVRR